MRAVRPKHFVATKAGVRARLDDREMLLVVTALSKTFAEFEESTDEMVQGGLLNPTLLRLFPTTHVDDADAEREYQQMVRPTLAKTHLESMRHVHDGLKQLSEHGGSIELTLEQARGWLRGLNVMRLVMGTQLDVSEDELPSITGDTERDKEHVEFIYLGLMLDELVNAVHRLDPDVG